MVNYTKWHENDVKNIFIDIELKFEVLCAYFPYFPNREFMAISCDIVQYLTCAFYFIEKLENYFNLMIIDGE